VGAKREVTLTLNRRGGALQGRVLGPDGAPVPNALVVIDPDVREFIRLEDGTQALDSLELRTRTSEDGTFRFDAVRPGSRSIGVREVEPAPWHDDVDVHEGSTARLEVRLLPGAVLTGTITGAGGQPVPRAQIAAHQAHYTFDEVSGRTEADGTFRLVGLPPGTIDVQATSRKHGEAEDEVTLIAGE